jgi:hypothetical protein
MKAKILKIAGIVLSVLLLMAVAAGCTGTPQETASEVTGSAELDPSQTPEASASESPSASETAGTDLLKTMMEKAKEGLVINCDFAVDSDIGNVNDQWGEPNKTDDAEDVASGIYETYDAENIAFGVNKGEQIFEVRSFDPELKTIKLSEVTAAYGEPDHTAEINSLNQEVYGYVVNDNYKMLLVFDMTTDSQDPNLDHYSVFDPQATVNQMAGDPGREW